MKKKTEILRLDINCFEGRVESKKRVDEEMYQKSRNMAKNRERSRDEAGAR